MKECGPVTELILRGELQELWRDKDVFALLQAVDGEVVRDKEDGKP